MVSEHVARLIPAAAELTIHHLSSALPGARGAVAGGGGACFPRCGNHRSRVRQQERDIREINLLFVFEEDGLDKAPVAGASVIHQAPCTVAAQDKQLIALVAFENHPGALVGLLAEVDITACFRGFDSCHAASHRVAVYSSGHLAQILTADVALTPLVGTQHPAVPVKRFVCFDGAAIGDAHKNLVLRPRSAAHVDRLSVLRGHKQGICTGSGSAQQQGRQAEKNPPESHHRHSSIFQFP